jgi:hypothetical protein
VLSEEVCRLAGVPPVTLTDSLTENIGGDGQSCSADVVSPQWVETVAAIPDHQVEDLAQRWFAQVAEEHCAKPEGPTDDAVQAIRQLIHACRLAIPKRLPVVQTWSM